MEESFHYGLLRISIIQILKAHGFDKINPSTLNVIIDIYVRMLSMLVNKSLKASHVRNGTIDTIDILQGMLEIGLIKPDPHDEYNTKSVHSFKNWLESINNSTMTQINQVPNNFKKLIVENRKFDHQNINEKDEQLKKLKQKQDYYNNMDNNLPVNKLAEEEEDLDFDLHWLDYLIEKDYKYNRKKYEGTIFFEGTHPGDYLIELNEQTLRVNDYLPINVKYEE